MKPGQLVWTFTRTHFHAANWQRKPEENVSGRAPERANLGIDQAVQPSMNIQLLVETVTELG